MEGVVGSIPIVSTKHTLTVLKPPGLTVRGFFCFITLIMPATEKTMFNRQDLERLEDQTLAPFAQRSSQSRGRRHAENEHPYRTAFQRDRDRIIHSSAFRRLEYKTQVFVNHEGDYYRTRITHTLEVAQIARTAARALGLNPDLTEAVALAHDLGHGPFGHCGEKVLNDLMKDDGGFEHNVQSYRIVTLLEDKYPDFQGLNLTDEVLEGIDKHKARMEAPDAGEGAQHSLEAQVVDRSDEIAYTSHDLDDGLTSGLLEWDDLDKVAIWRDHAAKAWGVEPTLNREKVKYHIVRGVINELVSDLLEATEARLKKHGVKTLADIRRCPEELAGFSEKVLGRHLELKGFLFDHLYRHHRVLRIEAKSEQVIRTLFKLYEETPDILPRNTRQKIRDNANNTHRIICDYIAGMTDRFAIEEYEKLTQPAIRV
jgi:dGTPase